MAGFYLLLSMIRYLNVNHDEINYIPVQSRLGLSLETVQHNKPVGGDTC